jgi:hypothetical protein
MLSQRAEDPLAGLGDFAGSRLVRLAAAVLLCSAAASAGTLVHVDQDALGGANDGSSWDDAYLDLKDALLFAPAGAELRIAEGTYLPDQGTGLRSTTFGVAQALSLYGGYAGSGAPDPDARDPVATPTVLSGDLQGDDGPSFSNRSDNAYHVVTLGPPTIVLDGLTIRGGNADGALWPDFHGGGLRGAGPDDLIRDCTFLDNRADDQGGGMRSSATVEGCLFVGNHAGNWGGGAVLFGASVTDTVFEGNTAGSGVGFPRGAGALVEDGDMHGCVFRANVADGDGLGGGLAVHGTSSVTILGCSFEANVVTGDGQGGGAWDGDFDSSSTTFEQCAFLGNRVEGAAGVGGGVYGGEEDGGLTVARCVLTGNHAGGTGGAVYIREGGNVRRSTLVANTCGDATGAGAFKLGGSGLFVRSSIAWANTAGASQTESAQLDGTTLPPNVNYSCVMGWSGAFAGTGSIGAAPQFVDADGADDVFGTLDDDVGLTSGSPCIDTGDPGQPLDPDGTVIEMGAVYFDQDPPPARWTDLGQALPGTLGAPLLVGSGVNASGQQASLELSGALPFQLAYLVVGLTALNAPFKGGTLVPDADIVIVQATDGLGEVGLDTIWPAGTLPGVTFFVQTWIPDPGGPKGYAASNGLEGLTE